MFEEKFEEIFGEEYIIQRNYGNVPREELRVNGHFHPNELQKIILKSLMKYINKNSFNGTVYFSLRGLNRILKNKGFDISRENLYNELFDLTWCTLKVEDGKMWCLSKIIPGVRAVKQNGNTYFYVEFGPIIRDYIFELLDKKIE